MGLFSETVRKLSNKKDNLNLNWNFDVKTEIFSPLVAGNLTKGEETEIVFGTKDGRLFMLKEGEVIWHYDTESKMDKIEELFVDTDAIKSIYSKPVLFDLNEDGKKEVIFGSDLGILHVLNHLGKLIWSYKTKGEIRGSVLIADINGNKKKEILFGSNDGKLYVLDSKGKLVWYFKAQTGIQSTPEFFNSNNKKMIIFGSDDGTIYAVSNKGELIWSFKTKGRVTAQPAIGDIDNCGKEHIIIGSSDNNLYVINENGILEWNYKTEGRILSKATLADINNDKKLEIIFGSCDDNIYALSSDGSKIWSYETNFWVVAQPIVTDINNDGKMEVIVGSYDHNIYVLNAEGTYLLDYMPGISSVVQQTGHYTDILTNEPGRYVGELIYKFKTEGMILGCDYTKNKKKEIVLNTKNGIVDDLNINKEDEKNA